MAARGGRAATADAACRLCRYAASRRPTLCEFLVKHRKVYSILSWGIHELNEQECLSFFPVARASIIQFLEEERRHKEQEAERVEIGNAIANYHPRTKPGGGA